MKKILSLVLATAMLLGTFSVAYAASTPKITGMEKPLSVGYSGSTDLGTIAPQDNRVITINLTDDMFTWNESKGTATDATTPTQLTSAQIRDAKLTVKTSGSTSRVLNNVSINNSKGVIEVDFIKELVGTKEVDFNFDVYLLIDNQRQQNHSINFSGTMANPVIDVYSDTDYEDISNGEVVEAQDTIRSIDLEIGCGVTLTTRISNGKKVYATATYGEDDRFMRDNRKVEEVIVLKTSGLTAGSTTVKLDSEYRDYYIYDADGKYLGRGRDKLDLSTRYYLASSKLDIDDGRNDEHHSGNLSSGSSSSASSSSSSSSSTPASAVKEPAINSNYNPNTGAGLYSPSNVNDNPGTGR